MGGILLVGLLHLVTGSVGGRLAGLAITDHHLYPCNWTCVSQTIN